VPTDERYAESLNRALDVVARERRFIGFLEAPPVEKSLKLIRHVLTGGGVQRLAIAGDDEVVGWCDILRNQMEGFRHGGRMGMALLPAYRGAGLGQRLLTETLDDARALGLERVDLEVFASNASAIALYRKLGFVVEGIKKNARKLDGKYDDDLIMALLLNA
jgi:ribosomal protein S18 acetylase RimI-like enzyme